MKVSYVWRRQTIVVAICLGVVLAARVYVARYLDPAGVEVSGSRPEATLDESASPEGSAVVEVPAPLP